MKHRILLFFCLCLAACSNENTLDIACEGDLEKLFVNPSGFRHEPLPNLTYFYRFEEGKVFKNHYAYGFPCSINTGNTIQCTIDLTLGDGSVTTITVDKISLRVTDTVLRKVPKMPNMPYSEAFTGQCQITKLP